jgi:iron complex outermembrane receptor protein
MTTFDTRLLLLASSLMPLAGLAQAPAPGDSGAGLQQIVVTAERRATELQRTPISLTAYTEETLAAQGIKTVQDLSLFTPGLSIGGEAEAGGTKPIFMIRGIGQPGGRESQERGVGLYVDDIYNSENHGLAAAIGICRHAGLSAR